MKILIAEDERITRRSLQRQMEGWGHEVVAAEDGAVAWELYQKEQFDLVVTDWDMPKMDGRELVSHIRKYKSEAYTYLIMLTARSETSDLVEGMEVGADDFLAKPFDKNELRVRLNAGERIIQLERQLAARNRDLAKANERMKHDLDAAGAMQKDLLPKGNQDKKSASFAWYYEPCDELGGDTLNIIPLDDDHVALYLLDVTGHGVPASLLSVTLSHTLTTRDPQSSIMISTDPDSGALLIRKPSDVVEQLNRQFPASAQKGRFFTMAYAVLNIRANILSYVVAGHPPPILMRNGQAGELETGQNFPVGIVEGADFKEIRLQLEPEDQIVFYSDGLTEAFNDMGDMLDVKGVKKLLQDNPGNGLQERVTMTVEALRKWTGSTPLGDDLSLLAFSVS